MAAVAAAWSTLAQRMKASRFSGPSDSGGMLSGMLARVGLGTGFLRNRLRVLATGCLAGDWGPMEAPGARSPSPSAEASDPDSAPGCSTACGAVIRRAATWATASPRWRAVC